MESRLTAYLARIGLAAPVTPDADGLEAVQRAHRMAIGFENFDVMLGRGIAIEAQAIFAKLVAGGRGGYCFEHNALFGDMLAAMGFPSRPLLARVFIGLPAGQMPPRTHTLRLVDLDGEAWIADAGFGAAYAPPLPLRDGAQATTPDGAQHRLIDQGGGAWRLERLGPQAATDGRAGDAQGWLHQHSFDLGEVAEIDLALSNHWTSTKPETRFTTACIASIVLEDGFASLNGRRLSVYTGGQSTVREISTAQEWRKVVGDLFNIALSAEEVAALYQAA